MNVRTDHGQRSFGDMPPVLAQRTRRVLFDGIGAERAP
jgi:hypothetical protein